MEKIIFLKYLKIYIDTDLKIILLDHQNKYVRNSNIKLSKAAKNFD